MTLCCGSGVGRVLPSGSAGAPCEVQLHRGDTAEFDAVALALPQREALQVFSEAQGWFHRELERRARFSAVFSFAESLGLPFNVAAVAGSPITMLANDSSRPGRAALPERWVVQTDTAWAIERGALEESGAWAEVGEELLGELSAVLGRALPEPLQSNCSPWVYSASLGGEPGSIGEGGSCMWDAGKGVGLCGDWFLDGRVEGAWLSGAELGRAIAAELGARE